VFVISGSEDKTQGIKSNPKIIEESNAKWDAPVTVENEQIQTLMDLGLTLLQAKIFLALSQIEKSTIATISKTAHVARQDTYRIMPSLEKLGLAEKIIANPTIYKATPIKEGYKLLLQNKNKEHIELQKKTNRMIKKTPESYSFPTLREENQQFCLISSIKILEKKVNLEDSLTQTNLDVIICGKYLITWLFSRRQNFEKAIQRGVRIRLLNEKHESSKTTLELPVALKSNPLFEIRYFGGLVPIKAAIYDGKIASLALGAPEDEDFTPSLWSSNPQFVKIVAAYFEYLWSESVGESVLSENSL
jgi:sugar-specific transcriptional regulator TrmB